VIEGSPSPGAAPDRRFLDSTAIRDELGWEPRWSLDDGLAATYRWYAEAGS
jgi:nucleoside-diphosphate-sugar epimerase